MSRYYLLLSAIIIIIIFCIILKKSKFKFDDKCIGIAANNKNTMYAISRDCVTKYSKLKKVKKTKLPTKRVNFGNIVNGELVLTTDMNELVWLTLNGQVNDVTSVNMDGRLTMIDYAFDKIWICEAFTGKDIPQTRIYCLDLEWEPQGDWLLSNQILHSINKHGITGGMWKNDKLFLFNKGTIFIVDVPPESDYVQLYKKIKTPMNGNFMSIQGKNICGVQDKSELINFNL